MNKNLKQPEGQSKALDTGLLTLAVVILVAGVLALAFLDEQPLSLRVGVIVVAIAASIGIAWFSDSGKRFLNYGRASWEELRRVVWPTRRETVNTTGMVMGFVVAVAFYLFLVDKLVEFALYDGLLRMTF